MKRYLPILFLFGCQSSDIHVNKNVVPLNKGEYLESGEEVVETPEQKYLRISNELGDKIQRLNKVGKGSVTVCDIKKNSSSMKVSYTNKYSKKVVVSVYDEHMVNSVYLYLNKKKAQEFEKTLYESYIKSRDNSDIEDLSLGTFSSGKKWVMLTSRNGKISGFWGDDWVDRVLTPIDPKQLIGCIEYVVPHIE